SHPTHYSFPTRRSSDLIRIHSGSARARWHLYTKSLWRSWLALIPESAMLGDSARVVIRFQIDRDRSRPIAPPSVERGAGYKMKSSTNAAISAVREARKSRRF